MNINNLITALAIVIATGLIAAVAYVQSDTWLKHQAVQSCKQVAQYREKQNEWIEIATPIEEEYQKCMQAKGY